MEALTQQQAAATANDPLLRVLAPIRASGQRVCSEIVALKGAVDEMATKQEHLNKTLDSHTNQITELQRQMKEVQRGGGGSASSSSAGGSSRSGPNPFGSFRPSPYATGPRKKVFVSGWGPDTSKQAED